MVTLSKWSMYKSLRLEEKQEPKLGTAWVPFLKVFSNIVGHNDPKWGSIRECMAGGVVSFLEN